MASRLTRLLGALSLLGVGVAHLQQYSADSYSAIPTIGTLFVLNFVSATAVALVLVLPVGRIAGRRGEGLHAAAAVSGIAIATGALAGLYVSEHGGLFGFTERGYRGAIAVSVALEALTIVLLGLFLASAWARRRGVGGAGFEPA